LSDAPSHPGGTTAAREGGARTPTRAIVALSVAACGSAAALRVCDPLLPRITTEFGVGLGAAAQTVTAFAIAYGVLQLAYGPIGDRYGKYRVVTVATGASALTSLACALAPTFGSLVLARLVAGATAGALIPLSLAWIGDAVPYERRQPVLARFLLGQMFGIALGQLLGGLGADHWGVGAVFLVLTAWFAATTGLLWRFGPRDTRGAASAVQTGTIVSRFAAVLRVRWARFVLASVFLEGVVLFGADAFIPTHLNRAYGVPLTAAGAVVMLYGVGGMIFALLSGMLVRRLGEPGLAASGALLFALCLVAIALSTSVPLAALACLAAGLGFYMLHNTLQVNATQMAPAQRGSSVALFAACLFIGQSTGVALGGFVAERIGTGPVILASSGAVLAVGLAFAAARRRLAAAAR
jgi:predicted MFS family arabinose efflux permease